MNLVIDTGTMVTHNLCLELCIYSVIDLPFLLPVQFYQVDRLYREDPTSVQDGQQYDIIMIISHTHS